MSSIDRALELTPNLLQVFLKNIFVGRDISLKLALIGQVIIQAARPKGFIDAVRLG